MTTPANCKTMVEVRTGVDKVDRQLAALLGERFAFMDAAARIKTARETVRDEPRKAQVLGNARENARVSGVPKDVAVKLWDELVEASIAYELSVFDAKRG